jgi:hypothetical protein
MADETEEQGPGPGTGSGNDPRQPFVAFHRPGILETGEGSLLEHTRSLVDVSLKPTVAQLDIGNGEAALIELGREGDDTKFSVLPPSDFDAYRKNPLYRRGTAELGSLDSLIEYTNRFKDSDSVVFADDERKSPSITTVLDYHPHGGPDAGARFGRHQARHMLPLSDEWRAWAELNGEAITMSNFARFLEDHIVDVMPPGMIELSEAQDKFVQTLGGTGRIADPAKLMELATGMRVFEEAEVTQATRIQTGESQLVVKNKHVDEQGVELIVPSMFVIAIPVFRHGEPYQLLVRLRYRKTGQGIVFVYELWRDDRVFDHAFDEAAQRLQDETSLLVLRGKRGDS